MTIAREKITQPGDTVKVVGEGMPVHNMSSDFGDLFVKLNVHLPKKLTTE